MVDFNMFDGLHSNCDCPFCVEDVDELTEAMHSQSALGIVKSVTTYMAEVDQSEADTLLAGLLGTIVLLLAQGDKVLANRLLDVLMQEIYSHLTNSGGGNA